MRTIYKYPVEHNFTIIYRIHAPITKILTIQKQHDIPCLWAEVETNQEDKIFYVYRIGTGWPLDDFPPNLHYIGTLQEDDGALIWHYYYTTEEQ